MLSNLGNILLFLNVILSLSIIYIANRNLKISGGVDKNSIPLSLIHPSSIISPRCSIGNGTVIMPLCVINSFSKIGNGVIINTRSSIDHDNCLKSFSSIAPGVSTGGNVYVGERSAVSIGASISHGIKIGSDVVIGASSLVNKNIDNNWVAYGTPVKLIRERKIGDKYL